MERFTTETMLQSLTTLRVRIKKGLNRSYLPDFFSPAAKTSRTMREKDVGFSS
jgi:hypothetical protein